MKRFAVWMLALGLLLGLSACGGAETAERQVFAMDTVMTLSADGENAQTAVDRAEEALLRLEDTLSRTREDSDVSRINANGAVPTTGLAADTRELLRAAETYWQATGGAFDITVAPVMDAWGFGGDTYRVPDPVELAELLTHVNGGSVTLTADSAALGEGQAIDLGGIAKGYASDRVEQIFRDSGVDRGMISLGGNVFVLGGKQDGSPWRVGLRDPQDEDALAVILPLRDAYAITSGGYERYFEENGTVYHHIIDPSDGAPADSGLLSVTVVAAANGPEADGAGNGTMCDTLSTALFVMGEERALEFWRNSGYAFELALVTADGRVVVTAGLADSFEKVEGSGYTYETVS